jgi:hypothetical protein
MLINPPMTSYREQFIARHGGRDVCLLVDGVFYFPDGASMERSSPFGALWEPPDDLAECLRLQVHYWTNRTAQAEADFSERKSEVLAGPGEAGISELKSIKARVKECRAKLAAVRAALKDQLEFPPISEEEKRRRIDAAVAPRLNEIRRMLNHRRRVLTEQYEVQLGPGSAPAVRRAVEADLKAEVDAYDAELKEMRAKLAAEMFQPLTDEEKRQRRADRARMDAAAGAKHAQLREEAAAIKI